MAERIYVHCRHSLSVEGHHFTAWEIIPASLTCKVPEASLLRGITWLLSRLEVRAMITAPSNLKEKVSRVKNIPRKKKEY